MRQIDEALVHSKSLIYDDAPKQAWWQQKTKQIKIVLNKFLKNYFECIWSKLKDIVVGLR